jgi:hypothetical protein
MYGMRDDVIGPQFPYVLEEEVADEILLFDPQQKTFVSLNSTAADVWRMATGEYRFDEMVKRIAASYGVPTTEIRDQIEAAVRELREAGLIPSGEL